MYFTTFLIAPLIARPIYLNDLLTYFITFLGKFRIGFIILSRKNREDF